MKILDGQKGKRCDEKTYRTFTHKRCPVCKQVKAVSLFYRKTTRTARGWSWDSHCIECRRAQCVAYGQRNRGLRNERLRKWRIKNPDAAKKLDKRARLKSKYGLTEAQVQGMREQQGGRCAICEKETSRLFIDHCHTAGHVRALICQTCNTFLGWYEKKADAILRFQKYIEHYRP